MYHYSSRATIMLKIRSEYFHFAKLWKSLKETKRLCRYFRKNVNLPFLNTHIAPFRIDFLMNLRKIARLCPQIMHLNL